VDLTVPADPESLRPVRQALQRLAKSVALDEARTFALAVAAGEAINNAIEHAYGAARGSVSVRAWRDGQTVKVEIGDQGRWRRERPRSTGGRGLGVIRGLTQGFELATSATGTTVRFAVPLDASDARVERFAPPPAAAAAQRAGADIGANGAETAAPVHAAGLAEVRTIDGMRVIEISGDVDLAAVGRFTRLLDTAAAAGEGPLIVSLPATAYFDSQGIRALFRIARRLEINRRPLVLVVPARSPLRHLLNLVEFGSAFAMFQSVDEALAAFKAGGTA
jgi:anti-anti-sigma factor